MLAYIFNLGCLGSVETLDKDMPITEGEFLKQIMHLLILVHFGKNFCGKAAAYLPLSSVGVNAMGIPLHPFKNWLSSKS